MQRRGRLTDEALDAVREAIDIVDIASEHTKVERRGQRFVALCPFHKEKTPSLSLDPERKLYYCFGCGAGGDALGLHMELTGDNFATAIEHMADRYGVPLPRAATAPGDEARADRSERIQAALDAAYAFFRGKLRTEAVPQDYLRRRKVSSELIARFGVGFAPDGWQTLVSDLGRRLAMPDLEAAGLVARSRKNPDRPYDRFRNRLMFPIRSPSGRLLAFGGRTLGDDPAKYVNTNETDHFRKGTLLYGLDSARRAIREQGRVLLVEGYFDVIGAALSGIDWVVASMGTALTAGQVRLLSRYTDEVVLGYDGDRAGIEAARKAASLMLEAGLVVRRARFPAGQDPDSLRLDEGPEAVRSVVEEARDAVALEIGAVDYIVKPFSATELTARVGAALRRSAEPEPFLLGDMAIHYEQRLVTMAGRRVELTATEYELLRLLSMNAGRVVTNESLLRRVWGNHDSNDAKPVRTFVKQLRRKLGDDASRPAYILTERGVGYRMARPGEPPTP